MGCCSSRHRVKIGSRSRKKPSLGPEAINIGLQERVDRLKSSNFKRVYNHVMCYTHVPNEGILEKWDNLEDDDPAWDTDAASCFSDFNRPGKEGSKVLPLYMWDHISGEDPMWDTDAASCFSYETETYSLCRTVPEGDQAWDTDAASCFSEVLSGSVSESSFGSFSGPGSFSESSVESWYGPGSFSESLSSLSE